MGDIKKKKRKFSRPKQLYDRERIDSENLIVKKYGLKNKKEVWKAESKISRIRRQAKNLIPRPDAEKAKFFDKLNKIGIGVDDISKVLALRGEDFLNRRLQTLVFKKKLANSLNQARQLIVHKHILVDGVAVNKPSFVVKKNLENKISLKEKKVVKKKQESLSKDNAEVSEKINKVNKEGEKDGKK